MSHEGESPFAQALRGARRATGGVDDYILERLPDGKVRVRLVAVEIFGAACDHVDHHGNDQPFGYGLMDAVEAWSDCNRAVGRIFRVDENWMTRAAADCIEIVIDEAELPKLLHDWNEDDTRPPVLVLGRDTPPTSQTEQP